MQEVFGGGGDGCTLERKDQGAMERAAKAHASTYLHSFSHFSEMTSGSAALCGTDHHSWMYVRSHFYRSMATHEGGGFSHAFVDFHLCFSGRSHFSLPMTSATETKTCSNLGHVRNDS